MLKFQNNHTTTIETFEYFIITVYVVINDLYYQFAPHEIIHMRHILNVKLSDLAFFYKKSYHPLFRSVADETILTE